MPERTRVVHKISARGNGSSLPVPRSFLFALGLRNGDHVGMTLVDGGFFVSPIENEIQRTMNEQLVKAGVVKDEVPA